MFKRSIAIAFLFFANIVLLAMAVIPHHHHGEAICFVKSHCEQEDNHDKACHYQDNSQPLHGHEHSQDANCCRVADWVLTNVDVNSKHECFGHCATCGIDNGLFVAILPELQDLSVQSVRLPCRQIPVIETYLCLFVSQILGLRAPPLC